MTEIPDGKARTAKIAFSVAVGVLVVVVAGVLVFSLRSKQEPAKPQQTFEPAEETSTETSTPPSTEPTPSTAPTGTPGAQKPGSPSQARAAKIAFRVGDTIYVANEDGSASVRVFQASEGPYSLSPDGRTLAVVAGSTLNLIPVDGGKQALVKGAEAARPVWTPDSGSVLYVSSTSGAHGVMTVMRVKANGSGATALRQGIAVRVSPDGKVIAVLPAASAYSDLTPVYVSVSGGAFKPLSAAGHATCVSVTNDRAIVGLASANGAPSVISMNFSGGDQKQLLTAPADGTVATWSELCVSPDGRLVAATAMGDDGYSRVTVVPVAGGAQHPLLPRKDSYFRDWSADGTKAFLIEGNYFQGQSTTLVTVEPDGTGRRTVVTGAEP